MSGFVVGNNIFKENASINIDAGLEAKEPTLESFMQIVYENTVNYNAIVEAVGMEEVKYIQENGSEMIYESEEKASVLKKFQEAFDWAMKKMQEMWKSIKLWFNTEIYKDKEFLAKHKATLLKSDGEKTVIGTGFIFTPQFPGNGLENKIKETLPLPTSESFKDAIDLAKANAAENEDKLRKVFCPSVTTDSKLSTCLYAANRNGQSSAGNITLHIAAQVKILEHFATKYQMAEAEMKRVNDLYKRLQSTTKDVMKKAIDRAEDKSVPMEYLSFYLSWTNKVINYSTMTFGAYIDAIKAERAQAKKACLAVLNKEPVKESAFINSLNSIELV